MTKRIRVPKNGSLFNWLAENYGTGGFENYNYEQIQCLLFGLERLLSCCDSVEMYFLSKLFDKLSEYPALHRKLEDELKKYVGRWAMEVLLVIFFILILVLIFVAETYKPIKK